MWSSTTRTWSSLEVSIIPWKHGPSTINKAHFPQCNQYHTKSQWHVSKWWMNIYWLLDFRMATSRLGTSTIIHFQTCRLHTHKQWASSIRFLTICYQVMQVVKSRYGTVRTGMYCCKEKSLHRTIPITHLQWILKWRQSHLWSLQEQIL